MEVILLTHSREAEKSTNTGSLVLDCLPENTERIIWERKKTSPYLTALIEKQSVALLYPSSEMADRDHEMVTEIQSIETFILIDATWQEARKIYNRSPYLHQLPRYEISTEHESEFKLRRNQKAGGLCTAEVVIHLLNEKGLPEKAEELKSRFDQFNQK